MMTETSRFKTNYASFEVVLTSLAQVRISLQCVEFMNNVIMKFKKQKNTRRNVFFPPSFNPNPQNSVCLCMRHSLNEKNTKNCANEDFLSLYEMHYLFNWTEKLKTTHKV